MDFAQLRYLIAPLIDELKSFPHSMLASLCNDLGLPAPPESGTKRERLDDAFGRLPDSDLVNVANLILQRRSPAAKARIAIQDVLWADEPAIEVPKRYRREVAHALERIDLFVDPRRFDELLDRHWVLDTDPLAGWFGQSDTSLRAQIERHVHRNPDDWSVDHLFDQLGVYEASDYRFSQFLEGLASADLRHSEEQQRVFVQCVNGALKACGAELRESDLQGGYPVFSLVSLHAAQRGRPKNLIFASQLKPDLRFKDAIDNDVEILGNPDDVLVFDRPISSDGLRWKDLQSWWAETRKIEDPQEAKESLYRRLMACLPSSSPPQQLMFAAFYKAFGPAVPDLPALLPEVWLHWDPKTVRDRGKDALLRFRMDFLLLLPHGVRVVVEVDGKHHFADDSGRADVHRYAQMAAADRELKLAGYEVYRFGAAELSGDAGMSTSQDFFRRLFKRHGVAV